MGLSHLLLRAHAASADSTAETALQQSGILPSGLVPDYNKTQLALAWDCASAHLELIAPQDWRVCKLGSALAMLASGLPLGPESHALGGSCLDSLHDPEGLGLSTSSEQGPG